MSFSFFSKLRSSKQQLALIRDDLKRVREEMAAQVGHFAPYVKAYMGEICQTRGKMIRPGLALITAAATGGVKDSHVRFAALLELVHIATLVHDDVLDHAEIRRDRPTPNALWGNELAVLLGDSLLSHAMMMGADLGDISFCKRLSRAVRDVCQGEIEQSTRLFDLEMTKADYFELIQKKTAALFAVAMGGAAYLSGLDEELVASLDRMGSLLGVAYQVYDDVLDMVGSEGVAGKTLHTDAEKGKITLPVLFLLESEHEGVSTEVRDALEHREEVNYARLSHTKAFQEAISRSVDEGLARTEEAREALWLLPLSPARESLTEMTYRLDELMRECCC